MKIVQFDKPTLKVLRERIDAALAAVGEEFGITLTAGSASFAPDRANFKLELGLLASDGSAVPKERTDFLRYCGLFGLNASDWDATFVANGTTYRICGLAPNRPKFPLLGRRADGTVFKFTQAVITKYINSRSRA